MIRNRTIAALVFAVALVSCGQREPVAFRRAQAFIEGDRKVEWTLHVTLVASARPDEGEVREQMVHLGNTYRGQANLGRIVADVVDEGSGETVVTASAPVRGRAGLGEVQIRWTD